MAVEQKNFGLFQYVDNDSTNWNKRGEIDPIRNAVDGSAPPGAGNVWRETRRGYRARKIIYQDKASTLRTKTVIFYTAAAWNAIVLQTSTLTFSIEGSATGVVYTAVEKISERKPGQRKGFNLPEHP